MGFDHTYNPSERLTEADQRSQTLVDRPDSVKRQASGNVLSTAAA